jgi:hypothetical protein
MPKLNPDTERLEGQTLKRCPVPLLHQELLSLVSVFEKKAYLDVMERHTLVYAFHAVAAEKAWVQAVGAPIRRPLHLATRPTAQML